MSIDLLFETGQRTVLDSIDILAIFARLDRTVLPEGFQRFLRCLRLREFEYRLPSARLKHFVVQSGDKAKIPLF
jgi:hypothetical protein